jgi:hypothetical protein
MRIYQHSILCILWILLITHYLNLFPNNMHLLHINPPLFQYLEHHSFRVIKDHLMSGILYRLAQHILTLLVQLDCSGSVHPVLCAVIELYWKLKIVVCDDLVY